MAKFYQCDREGCDHTAPVHDDYQFESQHGFPIGFYRLQYDTDNTFRDRIFCSYECLFLDAVKRYPYLADRIAALAVA